MKSKKVYICTACGAKALQWQGQCVQCGEWNTLELKEVASSRLVVPKSKAKPERLDTGQVLSAQFFSTSIAELDNLLGGGFVPGGVILLGGEPGIGKSTLLLQLAVNVAREGKKSIYISGEESLSQIQSRAERLNLLPSAMLAMATNSLEEILALFESGDIPQLLIIDSVQTIACTSVDSIPGSPSQIRAVATELIHKAKENNTCIILVGHVTKDGQIAGPKLLEHMVDTVLYLEGDKEHLFRVLRVVKNRFGPSNELILWQMKAYGMEIVQDPSTFFLQARNASLSGSAIVMAVDGQKPFAVEVQALASNTFLAIPRRTALGIDANRLHLLLAVMEKKLKLNLGQMDIYAKIGGGLRINDPGLDLGLVASVLSSFFEQPLPEQAVFWGEVDLNGQIRPVLGHDLRLRQAEKLGYKPIFCPKVRSDASLGCATIMDLKRILFTT
ncbi:DNA repair protein RadA [Desulfohalobiaceae bacterium Ax17]|uniref:DNA repair protein RadA n=1 Tax=Desulfovulcanus ferrireducens TaxID=2831190 RepID=UPI00207BA0BD|nr:DNA repair protein RadA [Desulfovulcanus ferrireducens]